MPSLSAMGGLRVAGASALMAGMPCATYAVDIPCEYPFDTQVGPGPTGPLRSVEQTPTEAEIHTVSAFERAKTFVGRRFLTPTENLLDDGVGRVNVPSAGGDSRRSVRHVDRDGVFRACYYPGLRMAVA